VLPEIGIKGNTHMLMQDDNSLDIADIPAGLDRQAGRRTAVTRPRLRRGC
jgi:hypothetical protein